MKHKYASKSAFINGEKYYNPKLAKTYDVSCNGLANCKTQYEQNQKKTSIHRYRLWKAEDKKMDLNTDVNRSTKNKYSTKIDYIHNICVSGQIIDSNRLIHDKTISHQEKIYKRNRKNICSGN